jgi:hypothetical protein
MTTSPQQYYRSLVEALRLIASSATVQKASVDEGALVTDEITCTFAMHYPYAEQLAADGLLSPESLKSLAAIHKWAWLEVETEVHFPESLSRHAYWANGRRLAMRSLKLMGERLQPPNRAEFLSFSIDVGERDH